ncbi:MAG: nitroreductase family protein [Flavobacteriales bacterium]|nr:nitroreductase family protein [Flavobacteriales bacterium]
MRMKKLSATEAIRYRRSVRVQSDVPIDSALVKACIANATLAPNSSNMQLWEFYHITSEEANKNIKAACFNQPAARTAQQLIIPVVRMDLWKQRIQALKEDLIAGFEKAKERNPEKEAKAIAYLDDEMPEIYQKKSWWEKFRLQRNIRQQGKTKAVYREVSACDLRIIGQRSTALAAQNFMISMAEVGYDTCPMEGYDSLRIKEILGLPDTAEINMVIGCGIRAENGIYGDQFRLPLEDVYFEK